MNALITLRVPATSANLGSGFDTIGMAVSLYNIFKVTELLPEGEYKVEALGEGARELSSPKANLVVKAYEETCERWNVKGPGFALWCHNIIPLCRGLGSSAGAVVAGVLIAKYLTGYDADDDELLRAMTMIEGHPDNVAPCFLGGMVVSCWDGKELRYVNLPPLPPEVLCVVAVPDERVKTSDARNALPKEVPFGDAVFNVGRAALLTAAAGSALCCKIPCPASIRSTASGNRWPRRSRSTPVSAGTAYAKNRWNFLNLCASAPRRTYCGNIRISSAAACCSA